MRYQGMVALDADTLAEAFEGYFTQSEQLPTRMLLAADASCAVGLMLQKLPGVEEEDADGWRRAVALFETLGRDELLGTPPRDLLFRLFHEDRVRVRDARPLRFGCSCSRERVAAMLQSLGREEAGAAVQEAESEAGAGITAERFPPVAEVSCAFCGQTYRLTREEVQELFDRPATLPLTNTLQ